MAHGSDLVAAGVTAFHAAVLATWSDLSTPPAPGHADGVWHWIERNHVSNVLLWRADARARCKNAPDAEVAGCKRAIDRHDHACQDAAELIDAALLALFDAAAAPGARLSSETPGTMIDRLSRLSVQICHARRSADAAAAWPDARLKPLLARRRDLCECLDRLLRELADGTACIHLYGPPRAEVRPFGLLTRACRANRGTARRRWPPAPPRRPRTAP